jgi:hypothetical protein
MCVPPL